MYFFRLYVPLSLLENTTECFVTLLYNYNVVTVDEGTTAAEPGDVTDGGKRKRNKKKKGGVGTRKPRGPLSTKPADFQVLLAICCFLVQVVV